MQRQRLCQFTWGDQLCLPGYHIAQGLTGCAQLRRVAAQHVEHAMQRNTSSITATQTEPWLHAGFCSELKVERVRLARYGSHMYTAPPAPTHASAIVFNGMS